MNNPRQNTKQRKKTPMIHKRYGDKRNRDWAIRLEEDLRWLKK